MIFRVSRASGFPIILEEEEVHALDVLEKQMRWIELEEFERELRHSESLKELTIETTTFEELLVLLNSMHSVCPTTIDFQKRTLIIQDNGEVIN